MTEALFEHSEGAFLPTELALGPWAPGLLHGGPVAALCVDAAERDADHFTSLRATFEFLRPLVRTLLTVETSALREGRRLRVVDVIVRSAADVIAHGAVLQIAPARVDLPWQPDPTGAREDPTAMALFTMRPEMRNARVTGRTFFTDGVEIRVPDVASFFGGGMAWFRLRCPVLEGRQASPLARAAAVADFGNGVSAPSPPGTLPLSFVNASLDVQLVRPVAGEWIRLAASSEWTADGYGLTRSELGDMRGPVGVAAQVLVLAPAT